MNSARVGLLPCLLLLAACAKADPEAARCGDIPTNGCPLDGTADVCADTTCAAAYACNPGGSWTLDHSCPGFRPEEDAGQEAAQEAGPPTSDGNVCLDAGVPPGSSASGGAQCIALEDDDCPLAEVLVCGGDPVELCAVTGCGTLFICEPSGWVRWAECEDDGGFVFTPH